MKLPRLPKKIIQPIEPTGTALNPYHPEIGQEVWFQWASGIEHGVVVGRKGRDYAIRFLGGGVMKGQLVVKNQRELWSPGSFEHGGPIDDPHVSKVLGWDE